jgi:hypothetical protein
LYYKPLVVVRFLLDLLLNSTGLRRAPVRIVLVALVLPSSHDADDGIVVIVVLHLRRLPRVVGCVLRGRLRGSATSATTADLGAPQLLLVVHSLLGQVVVLHAVAHRFSLEVLGNHAKVLGVLQKLLLEDILLGVRPHVLELSVIKLSERVEDEAVVACKLSAPFLVGEEYRWDNCIRVHLLILILKITK